MQLTLGQAAKQVGVSKPTLSKAVSSGKLSATRREDGSFAIDAAELHRYVEANQHRFQPATGNPWRSETLEGNAGNGGSAVIGSLAEAHQRAALAEQSLSQMKAMLEDMRQERDRWHEIASRLALPAPSPAPKSETSWWSWLRSTG